MPNLQDIRETKPGAYPDQAIYAEFAAQSLGLRFRGLDRGSGLAFAIESQTGQMVFGGGRGSYFPQNNATAATLAADKYLSAVVLTDAGVPNLGGEYFFLGERHRAQRAAGHDRSDAIARFHALGSRAFVKPLTGSRGDFAQAIYDEAALVSYLDQVSRVYDSIIMQSIITGAEYRLFVLDDAVLFSTRKHPPFLLGDGVASLRDLLQARDAALVTHGISSAAMADRLDQVLPAGQRWKLPGRMNRSAGGDMSFEQAPEGAEDLAIRAVQALGLRIGGIDLFTGLDGEASMRVIEINANPSIRFLEDSGRDDLILAIWRHTFAAMDFLDV